MCTLVPPPVQRETLKTVKNPYALAGSLPGQTRAFALLRGIQHKTAYGPDSLAANADLPRSKNQDRSGPQEREHRLCASGRHLGGGPDRCGLP